MEKELDVERESREESDRHNARLRTSLAELTSEKGFLTTHPLIC